MRMQEEAAPDIHVLWWDFNRQRQSIREYFSELMTSHLEPFVSTVSRVDQEIIADGFQHRDAKSHLPSEIRDLGRFRWPDSDSAFSTGVLEDLGRSVICSMWTWCWSRVSVPAWQRTT